MASAYEPKRTLDPLNQFSFVCPIFRAQTKIASCFALQELSYRGEPPETRKGCQVALSASKCPIVVILADMRRKGDDPYHSATAKVGVLQADVLERIAPILVHDRDIDRAGMSPKEAERLHACNEEARAGGRKMKTIRPRDPTKTEIDAREEGKTKPVASTETITAAKTGDMAAAVNAAIKDGEA